MSSPSYFGQSLQQSAGTTYIRDYTHAAKIFEPAGFALAPKVKFLFHTFFEINPSAYNRNIDTGDNFSVLVKSIKLPSFNIKTHELNQYNRKRFVQTKINYDPISVTFHDDSSNVITKLWNAYYTYYYSDGTNLNVFKNAVGSDRQPVKISENASKQAYNSRNIYSESRTFMGNNSWGFLGNPNQSGKVPFFKNITIFGLSRHLFTAYTIINPIITKFDHDTYNYGDNSGTMECKMDLQYETVVYNEGAIDGRSPDAIVQGFGLDSSYDRRISPITKPNANGSVPINGEYIDAAGGFVRSLR